ncbi:hypothetical protein [Tardiphaga sp.]|uniref:hypothetical protein n=1 Tax=Tardiphaga sp. TaxID=1926292 RepID=UPI002610B63D|nr:hypothetical protein [Tardiphaga sp.]MDB5617462.1 hypothetical protein [Tardiphaga sp.]
MRFAQFAGEDGHSIYINPEKVRSVHFVSERACFVTFAHDHGIRIPLQAELVVADLKKASN